MHALLALPLLIIQVALLAQSAYLAFLTLAGLLYRTPRAPETSQGTAMRLAVLVPAHNEEALLPKLVASLRRGTYPQDSYDILVVADNCTDSTAEAAKNAGATVHERWDTQQTGKGYALHWLLEQIKPAEAEYDAYVFLDADCEVSPNFLAVMTQRLQAGNEAVQAYYTAAKPFTSSIATLRFAALVLKHQARARGRAVLGLPCGLFGTGMAFSRQVIAAHGWSAFTLAEDVEQQIKLAEDGLYVAFAPEAIVLSEMPSSFRQAKSQNLRWERGRLRLAASQGPHLLAAAVRDRRWKNIDILFEQVSPPLSVLTALAVLLLPVTFWLRYGPSFPLSVLTVLSLGIHVALGLFSNKAPLRTYTALLFAPIFVLWKLFIYVIALLPGSANWVRTQRSEH